jgi:hypothetical protein
MPSFRPVNEISDYVDKMQEWKQELADSGIEVSVNVLQTLGHIYFPEELSNKFPFQRKVDYLGNESKAGVCPLDKNLAAYLGRIYKLYASLKPNLIFVDDDYRYVMQNIFCFCPLHIGLLEKRLGKKISLDQLCDNLFNDSFEQSEIKITYHGILRESMENLAEIICDAVKTTSPKTRTGYMAAFVPIGTWGTDMNKLAKKFAGTNSQPFIRPQMHMYAETDLKSLPGVMAQPLLVRNIVDPDVELYPEIENYPYTRFSKSAQVTFLCMASCYLNGLDNLAVNFYDTFGSPFSRSPEYIDMLTENKKYFESLTKLVKYGTRATGIGIPLHPQSPLYRRTPGKNMAYEVFDQRLWDNWIPQLGLPIGYDWQKTPWLLLSGDDVLGYTDSQIDDYLKSGAIMDVRAAECLIYRGYQKRIGVKIGQDIPVDDVGFELYEDNEFNGEYSNSCAPLRAYVNDGDFKQLIPDSGNHKIISSIVNYKNKKVTPAVLLTENETKERFVICNFSPKQHLRISLVNPQRQTQFKNLFEYISKKKLPVCVTSHAYVQPVVIRNNKKTVVGLFNFSSETTTNIKLKFGFKFSSMKILEKSGVVSDFNGHLTLVPYDMKILVFE